MLLKERRKGRLQQGQILLICNPLGELYIVVRLLFDKGIVIPSMHGEGKDFLPMGKDLRSAIALMYIQVDNQDTLSTACLKQISSRHGLIVEHTKALSPIRVGVVGASGYIEGYTFLQGVVCPIYSTLYQG